jgi:hypothetical protein
MVKPFRVALNEAAAFLDYPEHEAAGSNLLSVHGKQAKPRNSTSEPKVKAPKYEWLRLIGRLVTSGETTPPMFPAKFPMPVHLPTSSGDAQLWWMTRRFAEPNPTRDDPLSNTTGALDRIRQSETLP